MHATLPRFNPISVSSGAIRPFSRVFYLCSGGKEIQILYLGAGVTIAVACSGSNEVRQLFSARGRTVALEQVMKSQHQKPDETRTFGLLIRAPDLFIFCVLHMIESTFVVRGYPASCFPACLTVIESQPYVADRHQLHNAFTAIRLCFRPLCSFSLGAVSDLLSCTQLGAI